LATSTRGPHPQTAATAIMPITAVAIKSCLILDTPRYQVGKPLIRTSKGNILKSLNFSQVYTNDFAREFQES